MKNMQSSSRVEYLVSLLHMQTAEPSPVARAM